MSNVVWELAIPGEALPDDFVKLVMEDWTLDPGIDTSGQFASVLGNEALRGRGLVIESGVADPLERIQILIENDIKNNKYQIIE